MDDQATFALLNRGESVGVFQLESGGMTNVAKRLQIDSFDDIIALIALYRPGPMQFIDEYIEKKKGTKSNRPGNAFDLYGFTNGETYLRDDIIKDRAKFTDSSITEENLFKEWGVRLGDPNRYQLVKKETEKSKTLYDYSTAFRRGPTTTNPSYFQMF